MAPHDDAGSAGLAQATPSAAAEQGQGGPSGTARDVVVLRLPAAGAYLSVLRTATASLASRLDFTIDDIEDLRIAVDEACAMLLVQAVPGADLECRFELTADAIQVDVSVLTLDGQEPSRDTFAWTVLTALAGEVDSSRDADDRVTLSLHKRRADLTGPGQP
jgi:serine/threonine-protein kinase RsbW